MTEGTSLPAVIWTVACFDRRRENPFPVYNKILTLDWNLPDADERQEILQVLEETKPAEHYSPGGLGDSVITMRHRPSRPDWRMLKYRKYFIEIAEQDYPRFFSDVHGRPARDVHLNAEYFEDETGKSITKYEMIQHVSGHEQPVIVGDPESILRLGPSAPIKSDSWDVAKANAIAQFLDVVVHIYRSEWHRSPQSMTFEATASGGRQLLEARFPNSEEIMAVLAYFRQLHAEDDLLRQACKCYTRHCGDSRKVWWVKERKRAFINSVGSSPCLFQAITATRREIIEMFMYGARLLHSASHRGHQERLRGFVAEHGQQKAVMIFNSCLMDLLSVAVVIYHVLRQDFEYWITQCGLEGPDRFSIGELFSGFSRDSSSRDG